MIYSENRYPLFRIMPGFKFLLNHNSGPYDKDRPRLLRLCITWTMAEKTFDLRGLKCPLPVLRTRKALAGMQAGDILLVACTDPLAAIDIPTLLAQTGDVLEGKHCQEGATTFRIRKS